MKRKKILVILFIVYLTIPIFFILAMAPSSDFKTPFPIINLSNPKFFPSDDVKSPSYNTYINKYDWEFDTNYAPLQILTIVHYNENSYLDDFGLLSAIPIAIFNDSGIKKISPIIYDNIIDNQNAMEFLLQWKKYNDYFGGLKRVIYIGDVPDQVRNKITDIFGAPSVYRPPLNFSSSNIYDLSAKIADYFWFSSSKVVISLANYTLINFENSQDLTPIIDVVANKETANITDTITSTDFNKYYDQNNVSINGGAIYVKVNSSKLELELIGNYSNPSNQWIFDTTNYTNNKWVFFPNVTHPANISDWGIHVFNNSIISADIPINLTFYNFTSNFHNFRVNYSNCRITFTINSSSCKIWLIEPNGQFYTASNTSGTISIDYPALGDWTLIVSGDEINDVPYQITINVANFTSDKEKFIESASNGATIASLLHVPLLYTDGNSLTDSVRNFLSELKPSEAIIVEPGNTINDTLLTQLGIPVTSLQNLTAITNYIYGVSGEKDIILTSLRNGYFAPASVIAAFHGGTVFPVYNSTYNFYTKALQNYKLLESSYYQSPLQNGPFYNDMVNLSNLYHNWINTIDPTSVNRTVIIVSPLDDLNPIFDRAIMGKSIVGRFIGDNQTETTIFIDRSILYRALSFNNITADSEIIYRPTHNHIFNCDGLIGANLIGTEYTIFNYTFSNDTYYHVVENTSSGQYGEIQIPYYIDLSNRAVIFENITQIDISLVAKIDYQTSNITFAGWKIFNWTSQNLVVLSNNIFNSTTDAVDSCSITTANLTDFVNNTLNNRIEIYFYINTTGPSLNASVNYLVFNTSMLVPFAKQNILMSSIAYWHNFTFNSQTYNYSEEIPDLFKNMDYKVLKATGYTEIINTLLDKMALWYHCGIGNFTSDPFKDSGYMEFLLFNYSRGFNSGGSVTDPLGSGENPINPTNKFWRSSDDIANSLFNQSVNLSVIILNDDFLASTKIPLIYLRKGATSVIANLRKNTLGYSEHLFYISLNKILNQNSSGVSLIKGFETVSHLYSFNIKGDVGENYPFNNYTEDSHQFIIFGDPEQILVNSSSRLVLPGNYRPLVLNILNKSIRTGNWNYNPDQTYPNLFDPIVYINATDIDSDENNPDFYVLSNFNLNPIGYLGSYLYNYLTTPIDEYNFKCSNIPLAGDRVFSYNDTDAPLTLNGIKIDWYVSDGTDNTTETSYLTLNSSPPTFWQYYRKDYAPTQYVLSRFYLNNGTYSAFLPYDQSNEIGRINETLIADIVIGDPDYDRLIGETAQTAVILCMNKTTQNGNHWINITLSLNQSISAFDDPSLDASHESWEIYGRCSWNGSYTFTSYDPIGNYDFWIKSIDTLHGNLTSFQKVIFSPSAQIVDWYAEIDNFRNNTDELFRENETLSIGAQFIDADDYHDPNNMTLPLCENDSVLLHCEENASLPVTGIEINGSHFENNYLQTFYNDSNYHSMVNNSDGEILMPYAINLTNSGMEFSKITEIKIKMGAKINSTENISFAGWKIYNWTSGSLVTIDAQAFNSTSEAIDSCIITQQNLSFFVNQTYSNRIEIYFHVKTNNKNNTKASINYIVFNVTYPVNKTGITAEIQLRSMNDGGWINKTMDYQKIFENWSFSWVFSSQNKSGIWRIYFNLTDKEGHWKVYDTNYNITVRNHIPVLINWSKSANFVYRNQIIMFFANATDVDVYNRSTGLVLTAALYHDKSGTWQNITMPFNSSINSWQLNWLTPIDPLVILGNYTYMVKVTDPDSDTDFINTHLNFTLLNNIPVIQVTKFIPNDFKLFDGEIIEIWGNFTDVEYLNYSIFQLNDSAGGMIQRKIFYPYQASNFSDFHLQFTRNEYSRLKYQGTWNFYIFIYDGDGDFSSVLYSISLKMPPFLPPPPPFPWEYLIVAGLVVTIILGTILVYRFYHREQVAVPVSRVKAIIKKMVEEREQAELEEQKLMEERLKKEKLKKPQVKPIKKEKPPPKEKIITKKEKLDKLEIKNLEVRLSETLNSARHAVRKNNFGYAAELYQRAAKIASKLGKYDKVKRFSERAEEYYKKRKKK
ncbi:MAG: hypothetical protein ACTSRG_07310 [Candidatus Helarchaeota archaeon]